ncbi:MAG: hypothetical protein ACM3SW_01070 [Actinomycetota bacterium]
MKQIFFTAIVLLLAAIGPNIFPAAQAGYSTLHLLAVRLLLPSIVALAVLAFALGKEQRELSRSILLGGAAGALATLSLEVIRLIGFHFDFMPGNLPRLMGVLLLDRFAEGPSLLSDIAGWTYHFWNGAAFGIIYAIVLGTRRRWAGALYGVALGIGFMLSPVVTSLGVGMFGLQFSYGFPITVLLAHLAFGWTLGVLARAFLGAHASLVMDGMRQCILPFHSRHATIPK